MKKQIDLSGLYVPSTEQVEQDKAKTKEELKRALNCHFLLNQTGNQYYPLKGISMQEKMSTCIQLGATDIGTIPRQEQLHEQCKQIMERRQGD